MWAQVNELLFKKYFGTRPVTPLHNLCLSKPIFTHPKDGWTSGWLRGCSSFLFPSTKQKHPFLEVVPKGRTQKIPVFRTPLPCPHVVYPLPLWSPSSSIRHYSMVLHCNSWCSTNMLIIDFIIMTCSSKQRCNRQSSCKQPHTGSQTYKCQPILCSVAQIVQYE